jgi:hypothetical protein
MHNKIQAPQFDCGHPRLDEANAVMVAYRAALQALLLAHERVTRCFDDVQPVKWTQRIEAAVDDPEAQERLRVEYDELSITQSHTLLNYELLWQRMTDSVRAAFKVIEDLIAWHESIERYDADAPFKPLIRAAVVSMDNELQARPRFDFEDRRTYRHKAMIKAYRKLMKELTERRSGMHYTTDLVVQGNKIRQYLNPDVDLRNIFVVELGDTAGRWPKNTALETLLRRLKTAERALRDAVSQFRAERNGSVNETQHAHRALAALYGETCARLDQKAIDEQNARRVDYEVARRRVQTLIAQFEALRNEVGTALFEAVEEAATFACADDTPKKVINQDYIDLEMRAVNNLLAADYALRSSGRQLAELKRTAGEDLSHGAGNRVVEEAFTAAAKRFAPSIERRQQGQS